MKLKPVILALAVASLGVAHGQTSFTSTSVTTAWNASRWNNSADAAPYASTFTANNAVNFTSGTYTFAGMGATTNVGNVTVASGVSVTFASIGSTYATGGAVRTIDVGSGGLFDLNGNAFSTAAGTGLIKDGAGVFGTGAGAFTGGFTLNAGTVVARGTTGLGSGASNTLTLNGGTLASNNSRDFATTRFGGGITIGGNVQFGELSTIVSIAGSAVDLSFANNVSLGGANRTLTLGNNGIQTFSGVISNTGSGGITFAANANTDGRFEITNTANTFTGDINVNSGEVRFTADGSLGNAANDIIIDGGRFSKASDSTTVTLGAGRTISVGDGAGTSISSPGSGTLVYNGIISNKSGETGSWAKQGGGALELGGASTYTGSTAINNGIVRLTTGNDRLPTGTVVSMGQAASSNLGTLDLNGFNQQIAGLNSTTGTSASVNNNTVTSSAAATLTIDTAGSNSYSYGDGTDANSGVIAGAISLVKSGTGTQILGDTNTYTGTTTVSAGTLKVTGSISSSDVTVDGGVLASGITGAIGKNVTVNSGGTLAAGGVGAVGAATVANNLTFGSGSIFNWDLNANSTSTGFDTVSATGTIDVSTTGTVLNVVFGSGVDLADAFWTTASPTQSWSMESIFGKALTIGSSFASVTSTANPTTQGSFSITGSTLTWTAVPEPSSALAGLLIAAGLLRRRRVA